MRKRICPVCDQEMQSSNYCRTCHRFVRNPYIRDINYYLNEAHPRDDADCSYHNFPPNAREGDLPYTRTVKQQQMMPAGQMGQAGQFRPAGQVGQAQIPVQPQAGWQQQTPSGRAAAPSYQASQMVRPVRAAYAAQTTKKKESSKWILFLAAFFVVVFIGASQFFRFVVKQINDIGPGSGFDVDLGAYEEEWDSIEWDEEGWQELEDEEVRAAGERCTGNAHFSATLDELESEVVQIIENHGYLVQDRYSYSHNTQYDDGDGDKYTSYSTWTSYEIKQEQADTEEYIDQDVYFDHDTATDELHSIEITLADMGHVITISREILDLMVTKEMISSAADYEQILAGINQQSFYNEEYYTTADERVEIWCYEYDECYCIYICPRERLWQQGMTQ